MRGGAILTLVVAAAGFTVWSDAPVAEAARTGDADEVRRLLADGADVNAARGDGMTALHFAAERGDEVIAEMLLYAGAAVEPVTRIGAYTPLHLAARADQPGVAAMLLEAGADPEARTASGEATPMHLAAGSGGVEILRALAAAGGDVNATESSWDQTPLIFAAAQNRPEAIRVLLELGADPNAQARTLVLREQSQLDAVANRRMREVLKAFDVADVEASTTQIQMAVEAARIAYREKEAEEAAKRAEAEAEDEDEEPARASRLQSRSTLTAKGGLTALLHAARQGHTEAALALLEGGADIDAVSGSDGTSPLLMATLNGQFDLAMLFLERGADPNLASTLNEMAPLWAAVNAAWQPRTRYPQPQQMAQQATTYMDLMEALLEAGADPDRRLSVHPWYMVYSGCGNRNCGLIDLNGATAFLRAAYATDLPAMKLLIAHGADPEIATRAPERRNRRTPDEQLREQHRTRLASDSAYAEMEDEERVEAMMALRDGLPDSLHADFPDFAIEDNPDEIRERLVREAEVADSLKALYPDPSGLEVVPPGGPGVSAIHAASGVGYGEGFAGNAHRHAPDAWLETVKYLVDELGADVNARDHNGYNAVHHAASRGDNAMIEYLVSKGADVMAVSRRGQTTVDMANGPVQRVSPFPETVALLESLGAVNNHNCMSCQ